MSETVGLKLDSALCNSRESVSTQYSPRTMASICVAFFSLCCDIFLLLMGLATLVRVLPLDKVCVSKALAPAGIWASLAWPFFSSELGCHSSCKGEAWIWLVIMEPVAAGASFNFSGGLGMAMRPTSTLLSCCITSFITSCKRMSQSLLTYVAQMMTLQFFRYIW